MTVQQNQLWKQGDLYIRVVRVERLRVEYKTMKDPTSKEGLCEQATKKEFCRLIKGATHFGMTTPLRAPNGVDVAGKVADAFALDSEF